MRIAQLAPLAESVPPAGYGGSEYVVSLLTEELVKRGHEVTLFASADSVTSARLVSSNCSGLRTGGIAPTRWAAYEMQSIMSLEKMQDDFDIIHNHMGYTALPLVRHFRTPVLSTLHNPVREYCAPVYLSCKDLPFVAISNSYRLLNFPSELNYVATIHNGIDFDSFACFKTSSESYLLFIGRICADKGAVEAIQIAQEIGLPIVLAGKVDDNDREYFKELFEPLLCLPGVKFLGEVSAEVKFELYRSAIATVCPVKFDEPFGLVLAESIASGTPVMALRRGAVAEVIIDKECGIVCDTTEELVSRFPEIRLISRMHCRKRAELLFSKERMTDQYENVFEQLLVKKPQVAACI